MVKEATSSVADNKARLQTLRRASVALEMVNLRGDHDGMQIEFVLAALELMPSNVGFSAHENMRTNQPLGWGQQILNIHKSILRSLSSEGILASLLLGSGVLGALISRIRQTTSYHLQDIITFQPLLFGASAGFICFLVLRGGKSIFLLDYSAEIQQINPYSSAFAALLSGLFTDRAYKLLSLCVDALASKIEAVVKTDLQSPAIEAENNGVLKSPDQTSHSNLSPSTSKTRSTTKTP